MPDTALDHLARQPQTSSIRRPLTSRQRLVAGIAVAAVLVIAGIWWLQEREVPTSYVSAPVTRGTIERRITATGAVNPVLTIIIGSYVSGVISEMSCDYNTRVKKGQICAKIDARPYQAALDQAQGQLMRDAAQLKGARINLDRYAASLRRNAISRQTYDDQAALVEQLEGTVRVDRALVQMAKVNLGYTNITSPVDGTVVARNITIGQTVAASFQTPTLFLIATDLTKMQVDANVSESDIGALKEGNRARFTVEAFPGRSFDGVVLQVRQAPQTVQNVVTYDVVVAVDNAQFLLKPGMTATVGIVAERRTDALRVPDQALRFVPSSQHEVTAVQPGDARSAQLQGQARVWVLRRGEPTPIPVTVGLDDDTYSEVTSGALTAGDQIIIGEQRAATRARTGQFRFGW